MSDLTAVLVFLVCLGLTLALVPVCDALMGKTRAGDGHGGSR